MREKVPKKDEYPWISDIKNGKLSQTCWSPNRSCGSNQRMPTEETDVRCLAELLPEVYDRLRELAGACLMKERSGHTLQPTALVHEAYLRLRHQRKVDWTNRAQFLGIAAKMMRRVLNNYARTRSASKRGGDDSLRLTLDKALDFGEQRDLAVAEVDGVLRDLEILDPRQGQIVELRFFGGLTVEEISNVLNISPRTVKREWATAKLWLRDKLSGDAV